jgi:DHA1 family bicyclomycin/chloramphenicol resistance-like MFS transporter
MGPVQFGLMFGATAVVIVTINWYSARLIGRFSVRTILVAGVTVMIAAALVFLLIVIAE